MLMKIRENVMRLYMLYLGTMQPGDIPVPGYLIQTDEGINILVDSGWPRQESKSYSALPDALLMKTV
jgi:hypothetical protein